MRHVHSLDLHCGCVLQYDIAILCLQISIFSVFVCVLVRLGLDHYVMPLFRCLVIVSILVSCLLSDY